MSDLTNPVTGHTISTTKESVEFWEAAGFRAVTAPKSTAKKASSSKKSSSSKKK